MPFHLCKQDVLWYFLQTLLNIIDLFLELEIETSKLRKERDVLCGKQELDSLQDEKLLHMRELDKALRFTKAENDELHKVSTNSVL